MSQRCWQRGLPGTKALPAPRALLSALALKLTSVERKSHVMDLVFDEGLALFAGLNVIPKATFFAQYGGRSGRSTSVRLLRGWLDHLRGHLAVEGASFDLGGSAASTGATTTSTAGRRDAARG